VGLAERIKLAFSLPLEPADLPRLTESITLLATNAKHRRHYNLLARTPLFWLTAIGGWSVRHSVIAYLTLTGTFLLPPNYRADSFGFFLVNLLFSFGRRYYSDSMIRLHVLRRIRASPENVVDLETEPLLALRYFLKDSIGSRSLAKYKRLAELVYFLKEAVYYPSLACIGLFFGSFAAILGSVWIPAVRPWDWILVDAAEIGVWGLGIGMILLVVVNYVGAWKLGAEKPIFVEESELSVLSSKKEDQEGWKEP